MLCFTIFCLQSWAEPKIKWEEFHIPLLHSNGLASILVWPNDGKKHPLAFISHGSPRDPNNRKLMTPFSYLGIAKELARRGYAVAIVLRRGYGDTNSELAEGIGSCKNPNYLRSAKESADDIRLSIDYLKKFPEVDSSTIVAIGFSAGGLATVALTASPPPGLKAAISFAGGRGSYAKDTVCQEGALVNAFRELGKTSRIPMLWIYSDNDHFFNPALAKQFYDAFTQSGGQAQFIKAPAFGSDGHFLFPSGLAQWIGYVDAFLNKQHLIFNSPLLPSAEELNTPAGLSKEAEAAFDKYRQGTLHKAFALAKDGAYGWTTKQLTISQAKEQALDYCHQYTKETCKVIAVDDELIADPNRT